MIVKDTVYKLVEEALADSESYIVDVIVRPGNQIIVELDNDEGMDLDECIRVNRFIEEHLDREVEDYELEVGSAGVTSPFKILRQYQKNIGNEVEVLSKDGRKFTAMLKDANEDTFTVTITKKVKLEGDKRKRDVEEDIVLPYDAVKYCKYQIRFK
ncbi:MAG: ribosome assembly cofactor RimP [Bacteroidales bacterium]